jgi:pimeloyl-ACP methyl ester carboxylesterase
MERAMPSFHNGDVEIAYLDEGEGEPIVLVHGFASTKNVNWVYPTWVSELKKNGRRVIALDNRGHGDPGHGRRRQRADGSPPDRARRRHGLFAGRADDGLAGVA